MLFRKKQQLTICILAGILVADFVLFGYMPLRSRLKEIQKKRDAQRLTINKAMSESRQMTAIRRQLEQLQMVVGDYESKVPVQRDLGAFLHKVANLMNEHNLKEQLIQPGEEVKLQGLNCLTISMRFKGNLSQVFEFYKQLQKLDRFVRIEQIKLVNDGDFGGDVNVETKATIYYRAQTEQG